MHMLRILPALLLIAASVAAGDDPAVSRLDPELVPLYRQLLAEAQRSELVGRQLTLKLDLKHASERLLLFSDTQIVVDSDTRYYLIRWQYDPEDVSALIGKTGIACRVSGRIVQVVANEISPRMPYLVVELQSVSL